MPCRGITCAQGRQPCATPDQCARRQPGASATALHQHNSDGTHRDDAAPATTATTATTATAASSDTTPTPLPWDWVDDLRDFALLAPIAACLVGAGAMAMGALVGWALKG